MMRSLLAVGIAVLLSILAPQTHAAGRASVPSYDCEEAKALPKEADQESRRIACEIPLRYQQDVSLAEWIGKAIRRHDMAAWLTTDALVEKKAFEDLQGEGRGWLTLEDDRGIDVRYFAGHEGRIDAIAAARLELEPFKVVQARKLSPPDPISSRERRLMHAKALALQSEGMNLCTKHAPNTVVFEFNENGKPEILVFVMSAWTDDAAPLGGYHMFRVSEDGESIVNHFAQTKACPMAEASRLKDMEALMVSHTTSAAPTMFHVFMGLQYRKPLYVSTTQNGLLWRVDRGQIFLVKQDQAPQAGTNAPDGASSRE